MARKLHTEIMKTEALKQALDKYKFDAAFGGARRDEEKSRAKERVLSFRTAQHRWDPEESAPRILASLQYAQGAGRKSARLSDVELDRADIWDYIARENIPVVPLYFAKERPVVRARRHAHHGGRRAHGARARRSRSSRRWCASARSAAIR